MAKAQEIADEYMSSLSDLTLNSKPLINMLTMLAEDNIQHAKFIVEAVEKHLEKVRSEYKLPVLYLIDSIVKNVGQAYTQLFTQNIVNTFCSVFEKVDEKVRAQMFKLRQTWNDVFPAKKLYTLDVRVQCIDPAWPITAHPPSLNIHVNPKFFSKPAKGGTAVPPPAVAVTVTAKQPPQPVVSAVPVVPEPGLNVNVPIVLDPKTLDMQSQVINKQKELLELRQKKLELELLQAKAKLEEQQKALEKQIVKPSQILLKPEVAKQLAESSPLLGIKVDDTIKTTIQAGKQQIPITNSTSGPRIAPVNASLVAASMRPRDPRLAGKTSTNVQIQQNATNNSIIVDSSLNKIKNTTKSSNNIVESSNDVIPDGKITNKIKSGQLIRKDPRLNIKLQQTGPISFNQNNKKRSNYEQNYNDKNGKVSQQQQQQNQSQSSPDKKSSNSKNQKSSSRNSKSKNSNSSDHNLKSKSSSDLSLKSQTTKHNKKSKSEHSSPSKSDKRTSKSSNSSPKKSEKRSRDHLTEKYEPTEKEQIQISPTVSSTSLSTTSSSPEKTFKDLKGSTKHRNYIRRDRNKSLSPEPKDVDLRIGAPPEKQPRLANVNEDSTPATIKNSLEESPGSKDVDLRTLVVPTPTPTPAQIGKKRLSTEDTEQSPAKKSKTEIFDVLFGNEDVDLRQLPPIQVPSSEAQVTTTQPQISARPPTPPPPIISTVTRPEPNENDKKTTKTKTTNPDFEALRAKLANATKMSEKEPLPIEDTDMRKSIFDKSDDTKIIISKADEQSIKTGNLSQELVEKVLFEIETRKLKEAQRRESEKSDTNPHNVTLQPISDDELSQDFSHSSHSSSDDDKNSKKPSRKDPKRRDRQNDVERRKRDREDRRKAPPAPIISKKRDSDNDKPWPRRRKKDRWADAPKVEPPQRRLPSLLNMQNFGPRRNFPPFVPNFNNFGTPMDIPVRQGSPSIDPMHNGELPNADPLVLEYIEKDTMRTINIDGSPREIRFYDETAIVIMSWDDPREISFQNGTRVVTFDDKDTYSLSFNEEYKTVTIGGVEHKIKLGAPTRELYIDGKWYECFFGGPGIGIELDGKMHVVKMDGPPPHVKIGNVKRTDLCAGKINLIINARQMVPVFLDSKPQKFDIEGKLHTLRFIDSLKTVLINEQPFKVEFGGLPKPITVHDKKHFIRFSVLPRGIKPGYIKIHNMEGETALPLPLSNETSEASEGQIDQLMPPPNEPALPMIGKRKLDNDSSVDTNRSSPIQQLGNLDMLSSIITSPMAAASNNTNGYQIDLNTQDSQDSFPIVSRSINDNTIPGLMTENVQPLPTIPPVMIPNLNINDLLQKLVATGIITSNNNKESSPQPPPTSRFDDVGPGVKPVLFNHPETLKIRQPILIASLFTGLQCSSCGVRFPPELSKQYSQHLDWHFRQNRRGKNSQRKALCRKWYYNVDDWKNFEEIEDLEEREKNWFESQQQQQQTENANEENEEEVEIPSVPADAYHNERCDVCHDKFDQFYNEEKEEWHLKNAISVNEKTYHPLCYEDLSINTTNDITLEQTLDNHETSTEVEPIIVEEITDENSKEDNKSEDDVVEVKEDSEDVKSEEGKEEAVDDNKEDVEDDGDDDDVQILPEIVEQIIIDDDPDDSKIEDSTENKVETDQNTTPTEEEVALMLQNIKSEPGLDETIDEVPIVPLSTSQVDNTQAELVSSIDGNVQLDSGPQITSNISKGIRINITKPIAPIQQKELNTQQTEPTEQETLPPIQNISENLPLESDEPLPPGEEPIQLNLKPALQGLKLSKQPTVFKGQELTGMCSIM